MGFTNGDVRIYPQDDFSSFMSVKQHEGTDGSITSAKLSYDERFLLTSGEDGLVIAHTLDKFMILQEAKFNPIEGVEGVDFMP